MAENARALAAVFKRAANANNLEKPFRAVVETHLIDLAVTEQIELVPHTEVTLGTGRADTIYNRFIIEWEKPGSLTNNNASRPNHHTIGQIKDYVETFWFRNRQAPGRVVGCCTDGRYFIFATKPDHNWNVSDPVPVDDQSCRKFLDYFFSLHSGIALLPEYLAEDFSAENVSKGNKSSDTLSESESLRYGAYVQSFFDNVDSYRLLTSAATCTASFFFRRNLNKWNAGHCSWY